MDQGEAQSNPLVAVELARRDQDGYRWPACALKILPERGDHSVILDGNGVPAFEGVSL